MTAKETSTMDFKELPDIGDSLRAHRYQEYLERYASVEGVIPEKYLDLYLFNVAYALMAVRRYADALEVAIRWHRTGDQTPAFARDLARGLLEKGACLWMLGREDEALTVWLDLCEGTRRGKYQFARDTVGGIYNGLILWFGASVKRDSSLLRKSEAYFKDRLRRLPSSATEEVWPVPASRFALAELSAVELADKTLREPEFLGGGVLDPASMEGRRRLCLAYALMGAAELLAGSDARAVGHFREASLLENPLSEIAWYLARYETERRA